MSSEQKLSNLRPGDAAVVKELYNNDDMKRRLMDIGLINNTYVECVGKSPGGDPIAFLIRGAVIAIRRDDCENISVIRIDRS